MMKQAVIALLLAGLAGTAQAHEVWIERDGAGPVRIYLGEPADPLPEGGDPEFAQLKAPRLLGAATQPMLTRKVGFIEVAAPAGDVRAWDDNVFAPWGNAGEKEGVVYYARAGRAEAAAQLPFEITPVTAHGNRFRLIRNGKPLGATKLTVITPDKWSKVFTTDADGVVALPIREQGRYLLSATIKEDGPAQLPGGDVRAVHHITTTTFTAK